MSVNLPNEAEVPLCKCRVLYLGTSYYNNSNKKNDDNIKINLKLIQDTISKRYPVNGEKYADGIETWLSLYPSGIQIEPSKIDDHLSDGIFFFPIKCLVYCGALRLVHSDLSKGNDGKWKFVPLDSELANETNNLKNPPIFVTIVRGVDPSSKGENIECHVFVVGMKKTAMKLVQSSQKAYNSCNESVDAFRKKYGNIPAVFKQVKNSNEKPIVRKYDENGFFYVINESSIDLWQLYEANNFSDDKSDDYKVLHRHSIKAPPDEMRSNYVERDIIENDFIDPYQEAPNLVRVEKTVDPITGQNIYVRWLARDEPPEPRIIETQRDETPSPAPPPLIIRESGPTPEPIIVEKIVQKKKPQLIIKEIHVNEPAPPPIKVVEEVVTDTNSSLEKNVYKKLLNTPYKAHKSKHHNNYNRYIDPYNLANYTTFNNIYPDYYSHRSKSHNKYYDYIANDLLKASKNRKSYQPQPHQENYYEYRKNKKTPIPSNAIPIYTHHQRRYNYSNEPAVENHKYYPSEQRRVNMKNDIKYNQSPQLNYHSSQRQEPKTQYRKIYVVDDDGRGIKKESRGNTRPVLGHNQQSPQLQQNNNNNNNYIYSTPQTAAKKY